MTDLRLFDLNLLIAFDALMEERNVTRASRRLGIGQPAMSYALARLRELFGDDLFIRTATSMQPTTRALELSGPIARIISDIRESVLADRAFRPDVTEKSSASARPTMRRSLCSPKFSRHCDQPRRRRVSRSTLSTAIN